MKVAAWFVLSVLALMIGVIVLGYVTLASAVDWQGVARAQTVAVVLLWARGLLRGERWQQGLSK